MKTGTLIIFSGLPGSGKSTLAAGLASGLGATYLRIDTVEQGLRDVCEISQIDGKGYELSYLIAQENLRLGNVVIADSVNPCELTRKAWNGVADEIGVKFINVEIICSDKTEHRHRVESREAPVPGLKKPTWKDVLERDYNPWTETCIQLDTSGRTVEQSLDELVSNLKSKGFAF